jgi:alpha-aminoadipate carrier protein LysW
MATCPECDADIDIDEFDVERGDVVSCPECGSNLAVAGVSPLELELVADDDEEADEFDEDEDDLEEDDEEEEEDWEE